MTTYASVDDVASRLGRPITSDAETAQVQAWLDDIEAAIRRGFRRAGYDFDAQVVLGEPTTEEVIAVEANRVANKVRYPDAKETSTTKSVDDAQVTRRRENVEINDELALTDTDWESLLPGAPVLSNAFSTRPSFEPDTCWPSGRTYL